MRKRYYRRSPFHLRLKKETIYQLSSLFLLLSAGLLVLSFSKKGPVLSRIYFLAIHYFGWGIVFLPLILGLAGLAMTRLKLKIAGANVVLGLSLLWLSALGLTGGGELGQETWENLEVLIGAAGAYLVLFSGTLVGTVILFNTSLDEALLLVIKIIAVSLKFVHGILRKIFSKKTLPKPAMQIKTGAPFPLLSSPPSLKQIQAKKEPLEGITTPSSFSPAKPWEYPPLSLFSELPDQKADRGDIQQNAAIIEKTLDSFGIAARVVEVNCGPAVTQYALEITMGTKLSKITGLSNDLALALAAPTGQIRIEAPIPGRSLVGVEIPNRSLEIVTLKTMLASPSLTASKNKLMVTLGLDVAGNPVFANLAKMPHVLIAGATGSGKSICINSFISTILYRTSPAEVKLILVDPKRVELTAYDGIPHLLTPVIVDLEKTVSAFKWAIGEMDRRYKLFAGSGARNIESYNEQQGFQAIPYIVIIVDELADIMMFAPAEVEDAICRIAQMARATGIHLVVSTQRPSVDVITGLIKANIPCRIAFNVTSMVDSRVILDTPGAEKLLGRGDMLYIPPEQSKPTRVQGAYVSEQEVKRLVDFLKERSAAADYTEETVVMPTVKIKGMFTGKTETNDKEKDDFFQEAVRVVCQYDRASASLLQRRLSIGYARAARILDQLEEAGVVGPGEVAKPREVLVRNAEEYLGQQTADTYA
ncbi:MAG: DNA translocase FtsK [bacterium]|nr:DNA translocase FtsK [bacterium]